MSWLEFKIAPLAAGTYIIYAIDFPYCTITPCTMDKIAPTRMRTFTVFEPMTIALTQKFSSTNVQPVKMAIDGNVMHIAVPQNGVIAIRSYSLRGELLAKPFERFLMAGEREICTDQIIAGIQGKKPLIMEISMDGVKALAKTVILSHSR